MSNVDTQCGRASKLAKPSLLLSWNVWVPYARAERHWEHEARDHGGGQSKPKGEMASGQSGGGEVSKLTVSGSRLAVGSTAGWSGQNRRRLPAGPRKKKASIRPV